MWVNPGLLSVQTETTAIEEERRFDVNSTFVAAKISKFHTARSLLPQSRRIWSGSRIGMSSIVGNGLIAGKPQFRVSVTACSVSRLPEQSLHEIGHLKASELQRRSRPRYSPDLLSRLDHL